MDCETLSDAMLVLGDSMEILEMKERINEIKEEEWRQDDSHPGHLEGWTLAHTYAAFLTLPDDFDQWEMADATGWTVAHVAAENKTLPDNFNKWELVNKFGWTVWEEMLASGYVHPNFDQWELKDEEGKTAFEKMVLFNTLEWWSNDRGLNPEFKYWDKVIDEEGNTCRDILKKQVEEQNELRKV